MSPLCMFFIKWIFSLLIFYFNMRDFSLCLRLSCYMTLILSYYFTFFITIILCLFFPVFHPKDMNLLVQNLSILLCCYDVLGLRLTFTFIHPCQYPCFICSLGSFRCLSSCGYHSILDLYSWHVLVIIFLFLPQFFCGFLMAMIYLSGCFTFLYFLLPPSVFIT